jgi:hypothetical protein
MTSPILRVLLFWSSGNSAWTLPVLWQQGGF